MTDKRTEKHAETHACDLIDRQAVIDLLKQMRKDGDMVPWEGKDVFARIRELPSAQPERKKGKWLHKWSGDGSVWLEQNCSECGVTFEEEPNNYNFCPHCGADMREDDHETD